MAILSKASETSSPLPFTPLISESTKKDWKLEEEENNLKNEQYCNNNNDPDVVDSGSSDFYDKLVTKGSTVFGHVNKTVALENISWIDMSLVQSGLQFYKKHYSTIYLTNLFTMILGLSVKSNSTAFYRIGNAMTSDGQFRRALLTQHTFVNFYKIFEETPQQILKFFQKVMKMHAFGSKVCLKGKPLPELLPAPKEWEVELSEVIRKDLDHLDNCDDPKILKKVDTWKPECPVNQLDIGLTTLNAFLAMWLHPGKYGLKGREEMNGFIHIWAIFSRLIGVEDEFNVGLAKDPQVYRKLFENALLGSLRNIDSYGVHLLNETVTGIGNLFPFFTIKGYMYGLLKYVVEVDGYKGANLWGLMGWKDKVFIGALKTYYWSLGNIPGFRGFANKLFSFVMSSAIRLYLKEKRRKIQ